MRNNTSINILIALVILFILRGILPYASYLVIIGFVMFTPYVLFKERKKLVNINLWKSSIKNYGLYILIGIITIVAYIFSSFKQLELLKDVFSIIALFVFVLGSILLIDNKEKSKYFINRFTNAYLITFSIAGLIGIIKYYFVFIGHPISFFPTNFSPSLSDDQNMYMMRILVAFVFLLHKIRKPISSISTKLYLNYCFLLFSFILIASNSRRGVFLFLLLLLITFIDMIISLIRKDKSIFNNIKYSIIVVSFSFLSLSYFFTVLSGQTRHSIFDRVFENHKSIEKTISYIGYRYATIIKPSTTLEDVSNYLWTDINKNSELKDGDELFHQKKYLQAFDYYTKAFKVFNEKNRFFEKLPKELKNSPKIIIESGRFDLLPYYLSSAEVKFDNVYRPTSYYSSIYAGPQDRIINGNSVLGYIFKNNTTKNSIQIRPSFPAVEKGIYDISFYIDTKHNTLNSMFGRISSLDTLDYEIIKSKVIELDNGLFSVNQRVAIKSNNTNKIFLYLGYKSATTVDSMWISDINWSLTGDKFIIKNDNTPESFYKYASWNFLQRNLKKQWVLNERKYWNDFRKISSSLLVEEHSIQEVNTFIDNIDTLLNNEIKKYSGELGYPIKQYNEVIVPILQTGSWLQLEKDVPAIKEGIYKISYLQNIKGNEAYFKLKEKNEQDFLIYNYLEKNVIKIDSNWSKISVVYEVKENASLMGTYRFGLKNGSAQDTIIIKDFKIETLEKGVIKHPTDYHNQLIHAYRNGLVLESNLRKDLDIYKSYNFSIDNDKSNNLSKSRIDRWKFALKLFSTYSLKEKLIGKGFMYSDVFSYRFSDNGVKRTKAGSPHNPYLSALLYSGIIGFIMFVVFIVQTFILYLRMRKEYLYIFFAYLIILFFTFFSGKSFFSFPLLIVFSIIPYIYSSNKIEEGENFN